MIPDQKIIAANWKMNKTNSEAAEFITKLKAEINNCDGFCKIIIFPSAIALESSARLCEDSKIEIGAQNCHWESSGAFTGEISVDMIKSVGAKYVLVGHSERRTYFSEDDETVNKKIRKILSSNLKPIFCIGENLEYRTNNMAKSVVETQIKRGLSAIENTKIEDIIIAYEPLWAIGTGRTINCDQLDEIGNIIKKTVFEEFGSQVQVIYGGSVNSQNAKSFLSLESIDGALIGGAALDEQSFLNIIKIAKGI